MCNMENESVLFNHVTWWSDRRGGRFPFRDQVLIAASLGSKVNGAVSRGLRWKLTTLGYTYFLCCTSSPLVQPRGISKALSRNINGSLRPRTHF